MSLPSSSSNIESLLLNETPIPDIMALRGVRTFLNKAQYLMEILHNMSSDLSGWHFQNQSKGLDSDLTQHCQRVILLKDISTVTPVATAHPLSFEYAEKISSKFSLFCDTPVSLNCNQVICESDPKRLFDLPECYDMHNDKPLLTRNTGHLLGYLFDSRNQLQKIKNLIFDDFSYINCQSMWLKYQIPPLRLDEIRNADIAKEELRRYVTEKVNAYILSLICVNIFIGLFKRMFQGQLHGQSLRWM